MKEKHKAAFIIPFGSNRRLGKHGWEFETSQRVPLQVKEFLIRALKLQLLESYLGIDSYVDGNIKMSIFYDDQGLIENIYFQLRGDSLTTLFEVFRNSDFTNEVELFVPASTNS